MRFFDTHAHIGLIHDDPVEQLIICEEAKQAGVCGILSISSNLRDFSVIHDNLRSLSHIHYGVGIAPSEVGAINGDWETLVEEHAQRERVVAIGEIGLDYFRKYGDRDSQVELFVRQLEVAERLHLPVVIHNRDAGGDTLQILRDKLPSRGGVLHCYSEDSDYARKALELNLFISFAGNVTYRNARNLHDTLKQIPLERMLIETESPFMVPSAHRGKRNRPAYIADTAYFIAQQRSMELTELAEVLYQNSLTFFALDGA